MDIAVVGGGIAGTTIAWQLRTQGHRVTLFEQAAKCGPVGAGILLQPSGQAVLQQLGLLDAIRDVSPPIKSLHAQHRSGGTLVRLPYCKLSNDLFALGVLRGNLFSLLLDRCRSHGVEIREGHQIAEYVQSDSSVDLTCSNGGSAGSYDLLIAADGSRSRLREFSGLTRSVYEYPDAALWTIGPYTGPQDTLLQVVARCGRLMGMLPVGENRCSFFWGIKKTEEAEVRSAGSDRWKQQVAEFFPPAEEAVADVMSMDELIFASYRSVRMKRVTDGRVVFIGDAAHATSPHLGQGLNLALEDALCLLQHLKKYDDHRIAFKKYESDRTSTLSYYSTLTAALTPFFQTSNRLLQLGRDLSLPVMPHLPYVGRQMILTLAGLKTGWLSDNFQRSLASHQS